MLKKRKEALKESKVDRDPQAKQRYQEMCRQAKRAVSVTKTEATKEWYINLETREEQKSIYKIVKEGHRKSQVVENVCVIKDIRGNVLQKEEDVKKRWKECQELLNVENE